MVRTVVGVCLSALLLTTVALAGQDTSAADSASMEKKVTAINERGLAPDGVKPSPLRTTFTEREANAYFKVKGPEFLPVGVVAPEVTIGQGGAVRARATVDLDKALKPSLFNPLSWIGGKTEVTAAGVVTTNNGMGTLKLEGATVAGISVPKSLLQQLVSYYTRTPEAPEGFNLDKPFPLPSRITNVETIRGQATVVQP
jgi:hypothetical protein